MKQVIIFFILTFLISWLLWLPLYAKAIGINFTVQIPFNHAIGGLGPMISSILTTWIFTGKSGLRELFRKITGFSHALYFLIALLVPTVLLLIAMIADYFVNDSALDVAGIFRSNEFPQLSYLAFFGYNLLFFGFGEEAGWRGFALPRLQTKTNALWASVLLTLFWGLWHLPLFLYRPGYAGMDLAGASGWVFSLLTGSLLLTWLYNSTRGSILIAAIFHTTIDLAFTSDVGGKDTISFLGAMITVWGIAILLIYKPRNLSRLERVTLQTQ